MPYQFSLFTQRADKALEFIRNEIASLRTGRASAQLLDVVSVEAYGTKMKVNEVANVSVPDPSLLVIAPWDKSLLSAIERAVAVSGINLHPVVDGTVIRIVVPQLTEERRRELVKLLNQKIEAGRVMMRNVRAETKKEIEQQKEQGGVSEDTIALELDMLEKKTKEYMTKIDTLETEKEKELMTV